MSFVALDNQYWRKHAPISMFRIYFKIQPSWGCTKDPRAKIHIIPPTNFQAMPFWRYIFALINCPEKNSQPLKTSGNGWNMWLKSRNMKKRKKNQKYLVFHRKFRHKDDAKPPKSALGLILHTFLSVSVWSASLYEFSFRSYEFSCKSDKMQPNPGCFACS